MKSEQSTNSLQLQQQKRPAAQDQPWKPVHPFLRCVSALLSVVIAFTFGGPIQQVCGQTITSGTIYVSADDLSLQLDSSNGQIPLSTGTYVIKAGTYRIGTTDKVEDTPETIYIRNGTYLSTGTFLSAGTYFVKSGTYTSVESSLRATGTLDLSAATSFSAAKRDSLTIRVSPDPINSELTVTSGTLGSGTWNAVVGGLHFSDPAFSAAVAKKSEGDIDPVSTFEGATFTVNPEQLETLTIGATGLSIPYGIKLAFNKLDAQGNSMSGVRILLGANQTWTIGDDTSAYPSALAGNYADENSTAVRVDNTSQTPRNLRIATYTRDVSSEAPLSAAYLDVGPNINLSKTVDQGVLRLRRENSTASLFSGTIDISGGEVDLGDRFLQLSNGTGPTVSFTAINYAFINNEIVLVPLANQNLRLRITGTNVVGSIVEKLDSATNHQEAINNWVPTIVGPQTFGGGTLILELGTADLSLASEVRDHDSIPFTNALSLVKRGTGTFTPLNTRNTFSGGLTVETGTVHIRSSTVQEDNSTYGVIGVGPLVLAGGSVGATLIVGSDEVHDVVLDNDVKFQGFSDLSRTSKANIQGFAAGDSLTLRGSVLIEGESESAWTQLELNLSAPLTLTTTLSVAGTLTLSGGNTLFLSPEMSSNILGDFKLTDGTLSIGGNAIKTGISIAGLTGSRRILAAGTGAIVMAGEETVLPIWQSEFSFSGGSNTLDIQAYSSNNSAVAIRTTVAMILDDGTLALGTVQKANGAPDAVLRKSGAGTLEFRGNLISAGSLALTGLELLGGPVAFSGLSPVLFEAPVTLSASTLQISSGSRLSITGSVSGTGFTKAGQGALALAGTNTISGAITLESGPLSLASGTGAIFVGNAQTGASNAPTLFSTGTVSGAITVGSGATTAYTALLASGTSGTASFRGPITLASGTVGLELQAATGGTLDFSGAWSVNGQPISVGGTSRLGTVRLSSALSTAGGISVNWGALQVGTQNALVNSPVNLLNGAVLSLGTFTSTAGPVTLASGTILGTTGSLRDTSLTAQSGVISATVDGTSSLTKTGPGAVTVTGVSSYTGETRVTEGSLTSGLPLNSAINVTGGTYNLTLSATGTYSKTITNTGVIRLTGPDSSKSYELTIDAPGALSGAIEVVGNNVTLKAKAGVNDIFASDIKLTLNGAKFDANGTTQTIPTIVFLNGGSLTSSGALGTIKTNSQVPSANFSNVKVDPIDLPVARDVSVNGGTLEFYSGSLGDLASGGSYGQIVTQAKKQGDTLKFDDLVRGSTSVTARVSSGTFYTLNVESTVTTPLLDIQSGVTAVFKNDGNLTAGGTLQIGGTVDLDGNTKSFSSIRLTDGSLVKGTLSGGSLEVAGTGASLLSATLESGFGNITKNEDGSVTISGSSPNYGGSLFVNAGTVTLGTVSALGASAKIGGLATGAVLQLAGNHLEVEALSGSGILENSAVQAATLTFNPSADTTFAGVLRNGSSTGALSVVKSGSATLTLDATLEYTGGTTVKQGSLVLSNVLLPAVTALDVQGGTLDLGDRPQTVATYSQSGGSLLGVSLELTAGSYQLKGGSVGAVLGGTAAAVVEGNVTLNAAATYTGGTTVKAGTLSLGANGSLWTTSALTVQQGGAFSLGGKQQDLTSYTQTGGRVENGTITADSFSLKGGVVDAVLGGTGSATVEGVVTLNQAAAYIGKTTVQSGSLIFGTGGALSKTAEVEVQQGGTFSLGNKEQELGSYTQTGGRVENGTINANFFTLSGGLVNAVLAGTGAGAKVEGDVTLNRAATYSGQTTIVDSGRLTLGAQGTLASASSLSVEGGTLNLNGNSQTVDAFTITRGLVEAGTLNATTGYNLQGGSISAVLAGTASLGVNGNVTLSGANTVTGDTMIESAGTLTIANPAALSRSAVVSNGGSIRFASGISATTFAGLSGTQALALSNGTGGAVVLTLDLTGPQTYEGVLSGNGGLTVVGNGSLTLTGQSTFTGHTTINGGLLSAGDSLVGTSAINLNAGTFEAASYNSGAALKIAAPGTARIGGDIVSLGDISNAGNLSFTNPQGDITIGSLSGIGTTNFAASGTINGVLSGGIVNVTADLVVKSTISGGSITTRTALLEHVTGGAALRVTDSAVIQTVSNGTLVFEGNSSIITLSGGSVTNAGEMSVAMGTHSGSISGAGALLKQDSQSLTLNGNLNYTGKTKVLKGTLIIGENTSLSNSAGLTVESSAEAQFKNQSGTVTLNGLSGEGKTVFDGNAKVLSPVEKGVLSVAGTFTAGTFGKLEGTGPQLVAGGLDIETLQGGVVQAQGSSKLENLAGGSLKLAGGQSAITRLTGGDSTSLTLEGPARVQVSSGNYSGSIHGSGSFEKVGPESLDLANAPNETVKIAVQGGTLSAGNLLTGNRQVTVASGATLSLANVDKELVFSGALSGTGTTNLTGTGLTLGTGASLDGALNLKGDNFKLDISGLATQNAASNPFGGSALLAFEKSGVFVLGANQEVELNGLTLGGGTFTLDIQTTGAGAKILYDPSNRPTFLPGIQDMVVFSAESGVSNGVRVTGGSVTFDVLSQGGFITSDISASGTYRATAGRVLQRGGAPVSAATLLLEPKTADTDLRLASGTFGTQIIAGGTLAQGQGSVSLDGEVTAGGLTISSGVRFNFNGGGSLVTGAGAAAPATPITNRGSLAFTVESGSSKTVANVLSGAGSTEKLGDGTLELKGANKDLTGAFLLRAGTVLLGNQNALAGVGNSLLSFNGGVLKYGAGITSDLSLQIGTLASGVTAKVDTGTSNVNYGNLIGGTGSFEKTGVGTLAFTNGAHFEGNLGIKEGTVQIGGGVLKAQAAEVGSGATLSFASSGDLRYDGDLSGVGAVEQAGTGVLTLNGSNGGFGGKVGLKSGVLEFGSNQAIGNASLAFKGGTLRVGGSVTTPQISVIDPLAATDVARIETTSGTVVLNAALTGSGGLVKTGDGTLKLSDATAYTGSTSVLKGTLEAGNLLTGNRQVSVASGATLSLANVDSAVEFSGSLFGTGTTNLTGTGLTLGAGASLDGALNLKGDSFTLDISRLAISDSSTNTFGGNPFGGSAFLAFEKSGVFVLGSNQEVELNGLTLGGGTFTLDIQTTGAGAKILYDPSNRPTFLPIDQDLVVLSAGSSGLDGVSVTGGSVTFDVLSQGTLIAAGTYRATAGRVELRGESLTSVNTLVIDPKTASTIVRLNGGTFSQLVSVGGTSNQGEVLVGGLVTTKKVEVASNVLMKLAQAGGFVGAEAPEISNAGRLQFSVDAGTFKPVDNALTGTGSVEKLDTGTLVLNSKLNTYSGRTILSAGVLQMNDNSALGTGSVGSIVFNGGTLRYGGGVTADLSKRISPIQAGLSALIDVGANDVVYASSLSGQGGLSKSGIGTLRFAATQDFEGNLSVAAGTVQIGSGTLGSLAKAAAISVDPGASVRFARSDDLGYAGAITGTGTVEQAGNGTLALSGDGREFLGTYVLSSGVLLLDGADALSGGSITFRNGTLKYGQSGPSGVAADLSGRFNPVGAGFTATIDTSSSNVTYGTSLSGSGTLRKLGTGVLAFAEGAVNPLRTVVGAGTLHYIGTAAINAAGTIDTSTGTTVRFTNANDAEFKGSLQGTGAFVKDDLGTLTLVNAQPISGGVQIKAGSLVLGVQSALKGRVTLNADARLDISTTEGSHAPNLKDADLTIGGNLVVAGGITLVKSVDLLPGGTLTLNASPGDTAFIFAQESAKGTSPNPDVQVGTLTTKGNDGVPVISGSLYGNLRNLPANSELNLQGAGGRTATLLAGTFSSLSAEMGANLILEGQVTVKGGVLIGSSTLTLGGSSALSALSLNIVSGGTVKLENSEGLKGVGLVTVGTSTAERLIVSGTLKLADNQLLKGSGTIEGRVEVPQGAVLSPGNSPGTLTVGTLAFGNGGTLVLEHGQNAVDKLVTGGSLTLNDGAQILLVDYDRSLLSGTSGYAFSGSVATTGSVAVTMAVRLGNETGTVGDDGVAYPIATSALYSGSLTSTGSLVVKRLSAAQVVGAAGNLEKVALSVESRLKALSKTPFAVTDFDRIGTGATAAEAKLNLAQQLAAINPAIYAEMAALSTQRTLNIHQGLVGHFSSLRANLRETPDSVLNAWTTGYGAGHRQDGDTRLGTAGFSASTWGDLLGVEQRIGNLLLGVTGAAGRTTANFAHNPGSVTTDSFHGGLYGVLDLEDLLVESGVMFGGTDSRVRRTIAAPGITSRQSTTTLNGTEWVANLGISMPATVSPGLTITPSLRVIAQGQSQDSSRESDLGGLEMSLAKQRTTTFQHQAGVEARRKFVLAGRPVAASLQLDWIHNYQAKGRNLNMALSGDPTAAFGYQGSNAGADSVNVGAAFEAALTERTTFRFGGEYQGQKSLSTVRGTLSIGYQF